MIDGGLIGKVVKTENIHFLGFLYPNFAFVESISLLLYGNEPGIIYNGLSPRISRVERISLEDQRKKGVKDAFLYSKEYLERSNMVFVSTFSADGKYDLDLTDRTVILDLIYSKWGLDYNQYLDISMLEVLLEMDEVDFYDSIKLRWFSREFCLNHDNVGLYGSKAIYKLLHEPMGKTYATVLSIKNKENVLHLELALANFVRNAKAHNYQAGKKDDYNVMLENFDKNTLGKEKEIAVMLSKYRNMDHDRKIKLLWLIKQLKNSIREMENYDN